jgi:hypothetical protein
MREQVVVEEVSGLGNQFTDASGQTVRCDRILHL